MRSRSGHKQRLEGEIVRKVRRLFLNVNSTTSLRFELRRKMQNKNRETQRKMTSEGYTSAHATRARSHQSMDRFCAVLGEASRNHQADVFAGDASTGRGRADWHWAGGFGYCYGPGRTSVERGWLGWPQGKSFWD